MFPERKLIDINIVEDAMHFIFVGYWYGTSTCMEKKFPGAVILGGGPSFFRGAIFREAIFWGTLFLEAIFQRTIFHVSNISKIHFFK